MKFAVSCTFHMIDECDLDSTSLEVIEAESPRRAAIISVAKDMVEYDVDIVEESDEDNLKFYGISKQDVELFKADKEAFLEKRRRYWEKHVKFEKCEGTYEFYFDDQEGRSHGVFGLKVVKV